MLVQNRLYASSCVIGVVNPYTLWDFENMFKNPCSPHSTVKAIVAPKLNRQGRLFQAIAIVEREATAVCTQHHWNKGQEF